MKIRLQRLLAEAGLGSRRGCEDLISAGRVSVGGVIAQLGATVDPDSDSVAVDGKVVTAQTKEYWLLNKPAGVLSSVVDDRGRPTVTEHIPTSARVFPVGRLDLDSTGLILLTNDGALAERLLHPRYHVDKEYLVKVRGNIETRALEQLRRGVVLEEGKTSPAEIVVQETPAQSNGFMTTLRIIIHEGRKRQVRRMLEVVGHRVTALHRSRFATLTDKGLAVGQARRLTTQEISSLRRFARL